MAPSRVSRLTPRATRLFATVPPAPGVTTVDTTPTRGMPVSREASAVDGSYEHHRSRQISPTTNTFSFGIASRICAAVIGVADTPFATRARSRDDRHEYSNWSRHRRLFE